MALASFQRNEEFLLQGRRYRFERAVKTGVWLYEDLATGSSETIETEKLLRAWKDGNLVLVGRPSRPAKPMIESHAKEHFARLDKQTQDIVRMRLAVVREIWDLPRTHAVVRIAIRNLWKRQRRLDCPPSSDRAIAWKKAYYESNEDIRSLIPKDFRKGRRKAEMEGEINRILDREIKENFLRPEPMSRRRIWERVIEATMDLNDTRPADDQLPMISEYKVRQAIAELNEYDVFRAQRGADKARQRFRSVFNHRVFTRPLQEVQMDHCLVDLWVVDDETLLPRGRPWLTLAIDSFTRYVIGISIEFNEPSYLSLSKCLRHAIVPKVDLRDQYPEIENDWEGGPPDAIVGDGGLEFMGGAYEALCVHNGIRIVQAPRKTPWNKGIAERFFRTINEKVAHVTPGTTFSDVMKRGDYKSEERAAVRLSTFRKMVTKFIVDVYHQDDHESLDTSPAKMWEMHPVDQRLPCSVEDLEILLGKKLRRTLSHKGIQIDGLRYNSPGATRLRRRYQTSEHKGIGVDVYYDPEDLSAIHIEHESGWKERVPALWQDYTRGLNEWQHRKIREFARQNRLSIEQRRPMLRAKSMIEQWAQEEFERSGKRGRKRMSGQFHRFFSMGQAPNRTGRKRLNRLTNWLPET